MAYRLGIRRFLSKSLHFSHVLLVESGSRHLGEGFLRSLRVNHPESQVDVVTCYAGLPEPLPAGAKVYRVSDYPAGPARSQLYKELNSKIYDIIVIICAAEPIMFKWKWMLAARVPAKIVVLNENGDFFVADRTNIGLIFHFLLFRAGLTGSLAVRTVSRVVLFPFTLLYLILYAATINLRRKIRTL